MIRTYDQRIQKILWNEESNLSYVYTKVSAKSKYLPGQTKVNHKDPQSGELTPQPRSETGTSESKAINFTVSAQCHSIQYLKFKEGITLTLRN
jgi:hypothetical protein